MTQIAKFMWPTRGPPGSCRPQIGPMLAPWTLLSGECFIWPVIQLFVQQIVQAESNAPHDWPFMTRFPKWRAGNVERVTISLQHLINMMYGCFALKQSHIISMNRRSYETKSSLSSSFNLQNYSWFPLAPDPKQPVVCLSITPSWIFHFYNEMGAGYSVWIRTALCVMSFTTKCSPFMTSIFPNIQ